MGEKKWVLFDEFSCEECGDYIMIHTDSQEDNYFYDGDEVKCADGNCNAKGEVSIFNDEIGFRCEIE